MFRCNKCNQVSVPREKPIRVILETRVKIYPYREYAMKRGRGASKRYIADPGGQGTEIVRETLVHNRCVL